MGGRRGHWLTAVRRVFHRTEQNDNDDGDKKHHNNNNHHHHHHNRRRHSKSRGWVFSSCTNPSSYAESLGDVSPLVEETSAKAPLPPPQPTMQQKDVLQTEEEIMSGDEEKKEEVEEEEMKEESEHACSITLATSIAAEAPIVSPQAAEEVIRLTAWERLSGMSKEAAAAIIIQTTFRGFLARRVLRSLRGLVRLKSLVDGNVVKRQTANTLHCMQTLARVQSQIRSRRIKMTEENKALQRQLLLIRERELEKLRMGEEWDDSLKSKEQIEANLVNRQEAAIRRERALAYAFSHQWKSSSRSVNPMFMDPNNPQWGWSWLERWMAARPWESRSAIDSDRASVRITSSGGESTKTYAHQDTNSGRWSDVPNKSSRPPSRQTSAKALSVNGRAIPPSPRGIFGSLVDDSKSMLSLHLERHRRHSIGGSGIRDDESIASSTAKSSHHAPPKSAKAKSQYQTAMSDKNGTPHKGSVSSVKKRLSFPTQDSQTVNSPAKVRRHSVPPKMNIASLKEVSV